MSLVKKEGKLVKQGIHIDGTWQDIKPDQKAIAKKNRDNVINTLAVAASELVLNLYRRWSKLGRWRGVVNKGFLANTAVDDTKKSLTISSHPAETNY